MTGLHDALRELADEMPPARVDDELWTRASRTRRRRRVTSVGAAFAAVLVVVAGVAWLPGLTGGPRSLQPATGDSAGIPDEIRRPWAWTPTIMQYPGGAAAVVVDGPLVRDAVSGIGDEGRLVAIGARDDTYRTLPPFAQTSPGTMSLLSPDGTRLAYVSDKNYDLLIVRDLRTGRARVYGDGQHPLAWSPDGRSLATYVTTISDTSAETGDVRRLDLATGISTPLFKGVTSPQFVRGLAAAWSPDGTRLAFVAGNRFRTVGADGSDPVDLPISPRTLIAGPGAWSPDGRAVLLSAFVPCDGACRTSEKGAWQLYGVDPATGKEVDGYRFGIQESYGAVRVIAWRSSDAVVTVRYHPSSFGIEGLFRTDMWYQSLFDATGTEVAELRRGDGDRILAGPYEDVHNIDVAADLAATGAVREAGWPSPWPVHQYWVPVFAVPALVALLLLWLVGRWLRRRARASG